VFDAGARHGWVWVLAVCAFCTLVRASSPLGLVIRVTSKEDLALLERVRGQIGDLDATLITEDTGEPLESSLREQLATAHSRAEAQQAQVVIWFARDGDALSVLIAKPADERVLIRRLDRPAGSLGRSTQQEAAALIVRTAVRALSEGSEVGVHETDLVAPVAPPPPAPAHEPARAAPPPAPDPVVEPPERWSLSPYLGARASWDGVSDAGAHALTGRLTVERRALRLELRGDLGLASELSLAHARLRLVRHALSAHAAWIVLHGTRWQLALALGPGIAFYQTRAHSQEQAFSARTAELRSLFLSTDLTVSYAPRWGRGHLGWAGTLALEAYPIAPQLGYRDSQDGYVRETRVARFQPSLSLQIFLRWP
jgi:hypothetical protein